MSSPPLSPAVASAAVASRQALQALVGLAEALGTPGTVVTAAALAEAKAALEEAEAALAGLEAALVAAMAATAATPTPGLDAEGLYRALAVAADASAKELEQELRRNRRRRWGLWLVRTVTLVLMLLCVPLLSLDVVREALGVTQESHLVPSLATVALVCQVALWGTGTSKRHLATAASHQRHQAHRYRRLAWDTAAAAAATTEATKAIADANVTLGMLEEVTDHLRTLVDAVTQDLEMGQGFPASARALGGHRGGLGDSHGGQGGDGEVGPGAGGSAGGRVGTRMGTPGGSCSSWGTPPMSLLHLGDTPNVPIW
ncbi:uncharacterized protein LOC128901678 [Rissa tridactyla]|uniref:uncharacterized protein LOC128901678 n=1 Tax=Rissa tridactyla TaxID=75485 RepID=UPI0023BA4982|nr:uncharacterized protein LOC128901678 [Rissa tridactyla]XP_054039782.1 uncharacterized protein LOC128901678 [Rissa tridactyla]XP_054039783.1 uncharacterized protein LOC128901678 [Rissa tridactyla]